MRRIVSFVLLGAVLAVFLSGCGGKYKAGEGSEEDRRAAAEAIKQFRAKLAEVRDTERVRLPEALMDPDAEVAVIKVRRYGKAQLRATVDITSGGRSVRKLVLLRKQGGSVEVMSVN